MKNGLIALMLVFLAMFFLGPAKIYAQSSSATSSSSNITIESTPDKSSSAQLAEKAQSSWPWYLVRASGLMAAGLLFVMILSGIGQVTGLSFRYLEPITAWATHKAAGLSFLVLVFIHIFGIVVDKFVSFSILDVLIPFRSDYQPVTLLGHNFGSLYVALGIVSFYLLLLIIITSLIWIDRKPHTWKLLHLTSYLIVSFIFVHAIFLGTDLTSGILRLLWIASGLTILSFVIYRLWRVKTT